MNELHENLQYANEAIRYVKSFLTYGSNTKEDSLKPNWDPQRLLDMRKEVLEKARAYALQHDGHADFSVISKITKEALEKYRFGNCGEQAQAAFVFLDERGVYPLDFCKTSIGMHNLVVIGCNSDSNPEDISTWGPAAVVCDPWANKAYPVSHFLEMQKPKHDVRYPDICYISKPPAPYLAGSLVREFRNEQKQQLSKKETPVNALAPISIFKDRRNAQTKTSASSAGFGYLS